MRLSNKGYQKPIIALASIIIIGLIIYYPERSLQSALKGINTWVHVVLPALLPFFIVSETLIHSGIVDFLSILLNPIMRPLFNCPGYGSFVWIMSITSGYPMGPKLISTLYEENKITKIEGHRMLAFCNTSGPLFMMGAVGIGMLKNPQSGRIIAISHYISALIMGLIFRFYGNKKTNSHYTDKSPEPKVTIRRFFKNSQAKTKSLGSILGDSVRNSMQTQLLIGGFIILFSVIINLLLGGDPVANSNETPVRLAFILTRTPLPIKPIIAGIMEVTTGCQLVSESALSPSITLSVISFIIGWGGFSIHSQAISLMANTDLSISLYLFTKLLHGIIAALVTYVLTESPIPFSAPAYSDFSGVQSPYIIKTFTASLQLLLSTILGIIALLLISLVIKIIKSKNTKSISNINR
ncbi:MAG: sporulation integral membrane protein YlbJ [Clostridiales bacterium]|nr:sporulation integral membrane protein YlbJ [Clostridiales bacterium]